VGKQHLRLQSLNSSEKDGLDLEHRPDGRLFQRYHNGYGPKVSSTQLSVAKNIATPSAGLHNHRNIDTTPAMAHTLTKLYPWLSNPAIISAPMLGAATPALAANVTKACGLGFIAGGTRLDTLEASLQELASLTRTMVSHRQDILPIGVGFQLFNSQHSTATAAFSRLAPAVAWLFAPAEFTDLAEWAHGIREATGGKTHIWVQIGTVAEAKLAVELAEPEVLVVQGSDAGGHGLARSASIVSLVPEVKDMLASMGRADLPVLAAGGITDGRGVAAALALGAAGVVMGTRFLAASEAGIAAGWQKEITRLSDGGVSTTRSTLCDRLKETKGWPAWYDGRAAVNKGHEDEEGGMADDANVALYKDELKTGDLAWGSHGRMVTYAGTGVGLIHDVKPAAAIVEEVRSQARTSLKRVADAYGRDRAGPHL
jgi:nitronate monooxygenase